MPERSSADARRHALVKEGIARAEKASSDRGYVEVLRSHVLAAMPVALGGANARSLGLRPKEKKPRGPRLMDDPRYLANVRELARKTKRNARIIGGTLIAPDAVLTAGHCKKLHTRIFVGNDVDGRGREYRVSRHVRHPGWTGKYANDLMLLILEKPVSGVKPRHLASGEMIDGAKDARAVGFGTTDLADTVGYGRKLQVDVPIVSVACKGKVNGRKDGTVYGCHVGNEIVAGKPFLNRDTCRGDSGGPLYVADRGTWLLAGVTSRGATSPDRPRK